MTNKREIVSIANLGLAWGLKEARALLESKPGLKENVKVVFMKLDGLQNHTVTRLTSSLSGEIKPDAILSRNYSPSRKLEIIFEDFNIETEYQDGIFVACNGKGNINTQLQNNSSSFLAAEKIASNCDPGESNYVVFIDADVKQLLLQALPKGSTTEDMAEVIDLEHLEN